MGHSGYFIVLEGGEGVGKSTQAQLLTDRLRDEGYPVVATREPGGTPLAEEIRALVLSGKVTTGQTECLLFAAARADHVQQVILPALTAGKVVVCDRFVDSTLAYQGAARGLPAADILAANRIATQGLNPDLTILLDMDSREAVSRAQDANHWEAAGGAIHDKITTELRRLAAADPDNHKTVDASAAVATVAGQIWAAVADGIGARV